MKTGWLLTGLLIASLTMSVGCRNSRRNSSSGCCSTAMPTTTYAPVTQAPVFDSQFVAPTQSYESGPVPLTTTPLPGSPMQ